MFNTPRESLQTSSAGPGPLMLYGKTQPQSQIIGRFLFAHGCEKRLRSLEGNVFRTAVPTALEMLNDLAHLTPVDHTIDVRRKQGLGFCTLHGLVATSECFLTEPGSFF